MPRKSSAALSLVRPGPSSAYVAVPSDASPSQRRAFDGLVRTIPSEHFRDCDVPMLVRFVDLNLTADLASRKMEATGGPVVDGKINSWFSVHQRTTRMMGAVAVKLRMTPSARRDPKVVGRQLSRLNAYDRLAHEESDGDGDDDHERA